MASVYGKFLSSFGILFIALLLMSCAGGSSEQERPNLLLVISDDQSYPHASAYGYEAVQTPAFDRIAREGVLFTSAFVASPGCSPSRASLLTGRYPWQLEHAGTHASSFSTQYVVYPDLLEQAGYFVGYTGKGWGPGNWEAGGRSRNPAGPEYNDVRNENTPRGINSRDYSGNFRAFLDARPPGQPFCFWLGTSEPHRVFDKGIGVRSGKKIESVKVPAFLPNHPEVRSDILDYAFEIEWFDRHLATVLEILEGSGELANTLIVVTADNGMAFPRAKANLYEYGIHVPLAIRWPAQIPGGRVVDDPVTLVDVAPTFLEAAGVEHPGVPPMTGRSLMNILRSEQQGSVDSSRNQVFAGRERHSSSRHDNLGYPARVLRTREYLYIRNFKPELWPAGAPQKYEENGSLGPMHAAYHDIDASPSLSLLVENRNNPEIARYFHLAVDKRPAEELYDIRRDPACLENLAERAEYGEIRNDLAATLEEFLAETGDPRVGDNGDIFETYTRYSPIRKFPAP